MRIKHMMPDHGSIEDRRKLQMPNYAAKRSLEIKRTGYKEDPEAVRKRIMLGKDIESRLRGKGDRLK